MPLSFVLDTQTKSRRKCMKEMFFKIYLYIYIYNRKVLYESSKTSFMRKTTLRMILVIGMFLYKNLFFAKIKGAGSIK